MGSTETVNLPYEETGPESPEQMAAAKAESEEQSPEPTGTPEASGERPEWLPDKFSSPEDMAKSYKELESRLSSNKGKEPEELSIPSKEDAAESMTPEDMQFYMDRFAENGKLEDADYDSLKSRGIAKDIVDSYIAGQKALASQYEQSVYEQVGGQEAYSNMIAWAAENVSDSDVELFNAAVNSGNIAQANNAVNGMKARYQLENGNAPKLMQGKTSGSGTASYQSLAQMKEDMRDPRYHKDPAFRKSVADKLANSSIM